MKYFTIALALIFAIFLTGCSPRDDFDDYSVTEYPPVENVSVKTEFAEYDGNTELINVFLTNDRNEDLYFDRDWWLEKNADGEWRPIRFIEERYWTLETSSMSKGTLRISCNLKKFVKLPLLPGQYRIWVGADRGRVSAEFTVK